jgi:exopolyphosphatase/guanosine-5'-triphosphate,3'-diphosphate pyrophosphatase
MTIAAIDIGSNSVRLLILDDSGTQLVRETTVTALGRGVDATRRFRDDTVEATLDVMRRYAVAIDEYGATRVRAVATSASRDAENGEALMTAIGGIIGTEPEIIAGEAEAELSFEGATSKIDGEPPYLVIDIGGGSTEFVYGHTEPAYSTSLTGIPTVCWTVRARSSAT